MATPLSQMEILAVLTRINLSYFKGFLPQILDSEVALDHRLVHGVDCHPCEIPTHSLDKEEVFN